MTRAGRHYALRRYPDGTLGCTYIPTPSPGTGEMLLAPRIVGVCGTDLQILRGLRSDPAVILGHEGIGDVVAIGAGIDNFRVGQRVAFNPTDPVDQGRIIGHKFNGLYQERFLATRVTVARGMLVEVEAAVPDVLGAIIEPLAAVIYAHSFVQQMVTPTSIAIFGAGTVGLLYALYLKKLFGERIRVFLIYLNPRRVQWACARAIIRADECVSNSEAFNTMLGRRHGVHGVDAAILCTPRPAALSALRQAVEIVRDDGCIDLFGGFADGDRLDRLPGVDLNAVRRANRGGCPWPGRAFAVRTDAGKRLWLVGHRGVATDHLRAAMAQLTANPSHFGRVVSHVVSLEAAGAVLNRAGETSCKDIGGEPWVKLAIDCRIEGSMIRRVDSTLIAGALQAKPGLAQ